MSYGRDVIYVYDGTFDGLLTTVFESYRNHELPLSVTDDENIQEDLFCDIVTIKTDLQKAERVYNSIKNKFSSEILKNIYYVFLSDKSSKGRLCLDYIRAGYRFGKNVDNHLNISCVRKVLEIVLKVRNESEKYIEFVRFSELEGGIFYSEIEPKSNVLPIITPHFAARLSQQAWIIHDVGRKECMVYNGRGFCLMPTENLPELRYSQNEYVCRELWKKFYDAVEIKERHNERCRMGHMPKKYWKYMTEFNDISL